jgi:citrate lyase synthetase
MPETRDEFYEEVIIAGFGGQGIILAAAAFGTIMKCLAVRSQFRGLGHA